MNPLVASTPFASVAVNTVIDYLKLYILDKIMDPTSAAYDWVVRFLVGLLNLLANAVVYVAAGGDLAGAWQIIVAGAASVGISLGRFHIFTSVQDKRVQNTPALGTPAVAVGTPSTTVTNPFANSSGTSTFTWDPKATASAASMPTNYKSGTATPSTYQGFNQPTGPTSAPLAPAPSLTPTPGSEVKVQLERPAEVAKLTDKQIEDSLQSLPHAEPTVTQEPSGTVLYDSAAKTPDLKEGNLVGGDKPTVFKDVEKKT